MKTLTIVKIGGQVLDDEKRKMAFLKDFAALPGAKVLVHGGGKLATQLATQLNFPVQMHEGRRITDADSLRVAVMVYAGWINKTLAATLQAQGQKAIGLSGADAGLIQGVKRPIGEVDFGFVGDVVKEKVNAPLLQSLLEQGIAPIIAPITADASGQLLNTNADTIAAVLAMAMSGFYQVHLVYCFEKSGVLLDENDENSVIPMMDEQFMHRLKEEKRIHSGMLPKLHNCFQALEAGVKEIHICRETQVRHIGKGSFRGTKIGLS
jgi:acetylglutamate kinase